MINGYTKNKSVQYLISLLEKHGIKKVVVSPGTTDLEFTAALQYNGNFEMISAVDERGAAYIATGISEISREPVVICCTEATASRNYFSGLTESYYRKLPILAVTGVHRYAQVGHLIPQVIDRGVSPRDMCVKKVQLPIIKDAEDERETVLKINDALLELRRNGGGPVHIDLPCCNDEYEFETKTLPEVKKIERYFSFSEEIPSLPKGKIAVYIGSHHHFSEEETKVIDKFCAQNDAVVFCDHTSGYKGKYAFKSALVAFQKNSYDIFNNIELLIHLGESFADEKTFEKLKSAKEVWRVHIDGELRDSFGKLKNVFQMTEKEFFTRYLDDSQEEKKSNIENCLSLKKEIKIPYEKLPFSIMYVASKIAPSIPKKSIVHIGASNSVRAWSLFDFDDSVDVFANVGCRGIDGALSASIGASFLDSSRLTYCMLGDLTFFYDINSLGNRDIKPNLRILLVNNNGGCIFKLNGAPGHKFFGDETTDQYIAAAGHFGNKSENLVKHFSEDLGFEYITASDKDSFESGFEKFTSEDITDKPIIFEVFTNDFEDRESFNMMAGIDASDSEKAKNIVKNILGDKGTQTLRKIMGR